MRLIFQLRPELMGHFTELRNAMALSNLPKNVKPKKQKALRPDEVPQALKDKYAGKECTLDGQPATVANRRGDFGLVLSAGRPGIEFAWQTVEHVMENQGGRFSSGGTPAPKQDPALKHQVLAQYSRGPEGSKFWAYLTVVPMDEKTPYVVEWSSAEEGPKTTRYYGVGEAMKKFHDLVLSDLKKFKK